VQPILMRPLKVLFWQQTGLALQEAPDPIPTTEMGEHPRPIGTLTPPRTMPKIPRRPETKLLLDDWTELQHETDPTLHWLAGGAASAAAKATKEEMTRVFENFIFFSVWLRRSGLMVS